MKLTYCSTGQSVRREAVQLQLWSNSEFESQFYQVKMKQVKKRRQIPHSITYMWNLKYGTNEPIYGTEILIESGT